MVDVGEAFGVEIEPAAEVAGAGQQQHMPRHPVGLVGVLPTTRDPCRCSDAAASARPVSSRDGSTAEIAACGCSRHSFRPESTGSTASTARSCAPTAAWCWAMVVGSHPAQVGVLGARALTQAVNSAVAAWGPCRWAASS